jgi:hypothetical protein
LAEGLHNWGRQAVPLLNYTLVFALQLRKITQHLSHGSQVVKRLLIALTWLRFEEQPQLGCQVSVHHGYLLQTAISPQMVQVPSKLLN